MINKLIKLADYLDSAGSYEEAEKIDNMIKSLANYSAFSKEEKEGDNFSKVLTITNDTSSGPVAEVKFTKTDPKNGDKSGSQSYDNVEDAVKAFEKLNEQSEDLSDDAISHLMNKANEEEDNNKKANFINALISMADEFDAKGDFKKASLIDNFLKEAGPYDVKWQEENPKAQQTKRYDSKYHHSLQIKEPTKKTERINQKAYDTPSAKPYGQNGMSLQTRHCPDHIGVNLKRIGEGIYQCQMDNAIYNWGVGFKRQDGSEQPGGSVASQTPLANEYTTPSRIFDSRERVIKPIN